MDPKEYKQQYGVDIFAVGCNVLKNTYRAYFPIMSIADLTTDVTYNDPARVHLLNVVRNLVEKISLGTMTDDDLVAVMGGCIHLEKNMQPIDPMSVENAIAKLLAERWVTAMGFFDTPRVYTAEIDGQTCDVVETVYAGKVYKIYLRPIADDNDPRIEHVLKVLGREYTIEQTYDVFKGSIVKAEAAPFGQFSFEDVELNDKVLFASAVMAWIENTGSIEYDYEII